MADTFHHVVVAIHVVLYTTTLATESSPMFLKTGDGEGGKFIHKIIVPVVLFGVLLSTLHQSSLSGLSDSAGTVAFVV
jgi:hypothetical protein